MKRYSITLTLLVTLSSMHAAYCHTEKLDTMSIPISSLLLDSKTQLQLNESVASLAAPKYLTRTYQPVLFTTSSYPVDISFMIADIKFNGDSLKVLEFGEGTRSKFKGFDALYGDGKIWSRFWNYLSQFNLPMWYVGPQLRTQPAKDQISFNEFTELGGSYCPSKQELTKQLHKKPVARLNEATKIEDYSGIAMFRHQNASSPQAIEFKKHNPHAIILNYASAPYVNNKFLSNTLFESPDVENYKPLWKKYPKRYTKKLAKQVIEDIPADIYVIKPINAFKGNGIIMTTKSRLDFMLKNIINKTAIVRNSPNPTYNHWGKDTNDVFIVERFEHSKTIWTDGKPYEPTLRMVFTLHYSEKIITITFLGSYWKLPMRSLDEPGTLVERTKSSIDPEGKRPSSVVVDAADMEQAKTILSQVLPKLYIKMLQTRHLIP